MPVEWRLHVLEEMLAREYGETLDATIQVTDLYGLDSQEQRAALDAMISSQGDFPVTLVNGEAACVDDIDLAAIMDSVGRHLL